MTLGRLIVQLLGLEPPPPAVDKLRLEEAALCVDCETLSPARGVACCACGGISLLSLKRVLGGIRPEDSARLVETDDWWSRFTAASQVADRRCHDPAGNRPVQRDLQRSASAGRRLAGQNRKRRRT